MNSSTLVTVSRTSTSALQRKGNSTSNQSYQKRNNSSPGTFSANAATALNQHHHRVGAAASHLFQLDVALDRIKYLEQNLEYLQEKHQASLTDLHGEISKLQNACSDLMIEKSQMLKDEGTKDSDHMNKLKAENEELRSQVVRLEDWLNALLLKKEEKAQSVEPPSQVEQAPVMIKPSPPQNPSPSWNPRSNIRHATSSSTSSSSFLPQLSMKPSVFESLKQHQQQQQKKQLSKTSESSNGGASAEDGNQDFSKVSKPSSTSTKINHILAPILPFKIASSRSSASEKQIRPVVKPDELATPSKNEKTGLLSQLREKASKFL